MTERSIDSALWLKDPLREVHEARFQKLFDDADAMSIQGYLGDGTVVYWNKASEKIYGYTAEEALGGNLLDLIIPEEMRLGVQGAVRWMFEQGKGIPPGRLNLKHKEGHTVHVYSSHTVVSVPGQPPVLFCIDSDMHELAKAEDELRVAATAIECQQGMLVTDAKGVILRVNRAFTRSTGYSAEEIVGLRPSALKSDRHDRTFFRELWHSLVEAGHWEGEIWNKRKNGSIYADWVTISAVRNDEGVTTHYVGTFTDITQRKEAEAKIMRLAFFDPLTHLPNRRLLLDRLQQAVAASLRSGNAGALLFIDLDHFKTLNDSLGHDTGDQLLLLTAQRLATCIRENDTVARLGGDEFVVTLEGLSPNLTEAATQAEAAGRKILNTLNCIYSLKDNDYQGSVSIGITLFSRHESSVDELMKQADLAMYEAKSAGRNALRFFDPEMQAAVSHRALLIRDLRKAIAKQQFRLHFQPQVNSDGHIIGAEALLRWETPERGMIPPGEFIPAAEESGQIFAIGAWVLETACTQLNSWAADARTAHLTLAINVSAQQFSRTDFVDQVLDALAQTGANPKRLKLELTESQLVHHVDEVIRKMASLKAHGVGFSLDDFGTGYSSLAYLQRLPLDQLKIDQSFVQSALHDPTSAAIAQTIIVLGHAMGLSVIAEGVETPEQRELLLKLGCTTYQGYLFGRPVPEKQFLEMLVG